ncbi:MAG: (Fe-S)-binding protein [Candidatus Lokiarchaeota archaeon]|nr:(Fe-S)-binding protein [Candidatus Lokiarchaeota archaeon]
MTNCIENNNFIETAKCVDCKTCEEVCTIFQVMGKYSPWEKVQVAKEILNNHLKPENWETVFFCNKCEACAEFCPEHLDLSKIIDESRRLIVQKWGIQYPRQEMVIKNIFNTGNPFGREERRFNWITNYPKESKILLHLGCMMTFNLRNMGKSLINVLNKLKIDYTISDDEFCCGYFIYNTGDHDSAQKIIEKNKSYFSKYNKIITACAGCYTFIKQNYGLEIPIKHVIEVIDEKLNSEDIDISKLKDKEIIFHDSCHLTRPHGIIKPPREVLKRLGFKLKEFERNENKGICCGADGGMRIINPEFSKEIGKFRLQDAKNKAEILLTLCPFCMQNFQDCNESYGIDITIGNIFKELENILR